MKIKISLFLSLNILAIFTLINLASASTTDKLQPASNITYNEDLTVNGTGRFDSVYIGKTTGEGGVTFFNGTMINNSEGSVPLTMGDDLRVDGMIWRGPSKGTSDDMPLKIADSIVPAISDINNLGSEKLRWNSIFANNVDFSGNIVVDGVLSGSGSVIIDDELEVNENLTVNGVVGLTDNDIPNNITADNYLLRSGDNITGNITADTGITIDNTDISDNTSISYNDSIGFPLWLDGPRNPVGSSTNINTGNIQAGRVFFSCRLEAGTYGSVSNTSERVVIPESFSEAFSVVLTPTAPKTSFHIDFIYTAIPVSYNSFEIDTEQPSTGVCMQSYFNWIAIGY